MLQCRALLTLPLRGGGRHRHRARDHSSHAIGEHRLYRAARFAECGAEHSWVLSRQRCARHPGTCGLLAPRIALVTPFAHRWRLPATRRPRSTLPSDWSIHGASRRSLLARAACFGGRDVAHRQSAAYVVCGKLGTWIGTYICSHAPRLRVSTQPWPRRRRHTQPGWGHSGWPPRRPQAQCKRRAQSSRLRRPS